MVSDMQTMLNAALTGDFSTAKRLLDSGLGINDIIVLTDENAGPHAKLEVTALHIAVMISRTEVVEFLITNGADVSRRDGKGRTPFELASNDQIRRLLKVKAEIPMVKFIKCPKCSLSFSWTDVSSSGTKQITTQCPNCGSKISPESGPGDSEAKTAAGDEKKPWWKFW